MSLIKRDLDANIKFQQENPKASGSAAHRRYSKYSRATTVREALYLGAAPGDIKNDEAAGYLTRGPQRQKKKTSKKIMGGIVLDNKKYIVERFFCSLGIQARKHLSIKDAQASLKAIDKVQASVQLRINKKVMAGKSSTPEDFVTYVKAAVAEVKKASPDLGVENWRYYAKNRLAHPGFTAASLQNLRKDQQMSFSNGDIRVLQGTMESTLQGWLKLAKAAGLADLSEIVGVEGIDSGRRAADELAREELARMKKGERPSDAVVLKALRLWGFEKSTSRQNVMPEGHEWVHSDTLGVIENRNDHELIITTACKGNENFVRLLASWARKRSPNGYLPFTTISLNKNYAGRLHRDSGNIGPSIGVAIGPFTGGRLRFWAGDTGRGKRSQTVERVRDEPHVPLNIKRGVVFDGNCAHEVEPFQGERYSMIFFTLKKYKKASHIVKRKMVSMGADWPTTAALKRLQAKVPRLAAE